MRANILFSIRLWLLYVHSEFYKQRILYLFLRAGHERATECEYSREYNPLLPLFQLETNFVFPNTAPLCSPLLLATLRIILLQ